MEPQKIATKWAQNLIAAIDRSRQTTLERFLFALGMTHVGETTAKALAHSFGDLAIIRQLPWPLFKCVPDIGGEVARAIGHFMDQPANQQAIDDLVERGVRITDAHPPHLHCAINSPWPASWNTWRFQKSPHCVLSS